MSLSQERFSGMYQVLIRCLTPSFRFVSFLFFVFLFQSTSFSSSGYGGLGGVHGHASANSFEDDLTHPLVGEHIDDPGDDLFGVGVPVPSMGGMLPIGMSPMSGASHQASAHAHMSRSPVEHQLQYHHQQHQQQQHRGHFSHIEPMMQNPTGSGGGGAYNGPRNVYTIKFKRSQRNFIPGPRLSRDLRIGCYVKVEADRGEDLGIVVSKIPAEKLSGSGRSNYRGGGGNGGDMNMMNQPTAAISAAGIADLKRIIRLATHDEVALLAVKQNEEDELLRVCRTKVRQRGLPMHVVDAEYQFDRHKLTFFFEAEGRIDFRELVRDLFSMYKTRIWMQQLDKNTSSNNNTPNNNSNNSHQNTAGGGGNPNNSGTISSSNSTPPGLGLGGMSPNGMNTAVGLPPDFGMVGPPPQSLPQLHHHQQQQQQHHHQQQQQQQTPLMTMLPHMAPVSDSYFSPGGETMQGSTSG